MALRVLSFTRSTGLRSSTLSIAQRGYASSAADGNALSSGQKKLAIAGAVTLFAGGAFIYTTLQDADAQLKKNLEAKAAKAALRPIVLSGPSGAGKSTLKTKLMKEFPDAFAFSVSHTTRKPRPGEVDGVDYHFSDRAVMEQEVKEGKFIESATFSGNMYGTSKQAIADVAKTGRQCLLDVDMQGVKAIKNTDLNAKFVFVQAPSLEVLEQRLRARGTETEESLKLRLETAKKELEYAQTPGAYDLYIVNDDLEASYLKLKEYLKDDLEFHNKKAATKA
eukprot:Colp12_sorted_trinity150504_noHs@9012